MTERNVFNPSWKRSQLFPSGHLLKIEVLLRFPFRKFGRRFNSLAEYEGAHYAMIALIEIFVISEALIKLLLQHFFGVISLCCFLRTLLFKRRRKNRNPITKFTDSCTQRLYFKVPDIILPYNNYSFNIYNNRATLR